MTTVFTMTHKKFSEPKNTAYVPLHVGKSGKADLGYQGDDTGDSISALNCYYGELTGIYWVWKNYSGCENIGVCHYRRYFINSDRKLMTSDKYDVFYRRVYGFLSKQLLMVCIKKKNLKV